ncbi:MAG: 23S rRNA (guanosine(2251)-2'-O)-methyltransferase RlmB [Waddliaceae bacterium]|jgi:23S rRNA (guanosine2251-2'-O)-methyltransferase|nr:23S rRNA (guanosine(2251)-2'-O)-methyltransferase RlmB [Waddliaceae bacterium]MBT3579529.1 23S rRNA (guanosine(2251)-2'-O)-methyltransferase RlmB [Waddliaceae bacterium]MBT4444553.1 23S rRNA (guanosine(2251)-2'-O)-methyltransferase RlmB [Waddliaceae bacterium]MBT6928642.1 23S rRNA (guanosine(2251)-2'-O)-methyltransferase RlmB [Waddliaceae bacterium]MBT7265180.1 23S rRNA (guanosine(2251)-2'-O)-methyltransferase RlmB [Waddliaceae bacterium]
MRKNFRLIMGKNCISEVLRASPSRIVEVYTSQKSDDALYRELIKKKIRVKEVPKRDLGSLVNSDSHQSYVAAVKERGQPALKDFLVSSRDADKNLVVMLDSIYDPQNLGAILRSCECFGVDLVIYSKNRGTDITPVATKTSAGASELVDIAKVSNLAETIRAFKKEDFWVVCAEAGEESSSLYGFDFPDKTLLVLGSEGKGIQPIISKNADFRVYIPMLGNIDSLNVSQAAAVFLNSYRNN